MLLNSWLALRNSLNLTTTLIRGYLSKLPELRIVFELFKVYFYRIPHFSLIPCSFVRQRGETDNALQRTSFDTLFFRLGEEREKNVWIFVFSEYQKGKVKKKLNNLVLCPSYRNVVGSVQILTMGSARCSLLAL